MASLISGLLAAAGTVLAWHEPAHTVAWIFIVAGILLLLWEMTMPGFFIAVPAVVLVLVGLYGLILPGLLFSIYSPILAIAVAVPTTLGTLYVYKRIAPASDAPFTTMGDSLVGQLGQVTVEVVPDSTRGKVRIRGQIWSATSDRSIAVGTRVKVLGSEGVHVTVEPVETAPGTSVGAGSAGAEEFGSGGTP